MSRTGRPPHYIDPALRGESHQIDSSPIYNWGRPRNQRNKPASDGAPVESREPALGLQQQVGSILRHVENLFAPGGNALDRRAIDTLIAQPDVQAFLERLDNLKLLPTRREITPETE